MVDIESSIGQSRFKIKSDCVNDAGRHSQLSLFQGQQPNRITNANANHNARAVADHG